MRKSEALAWLRRSRIVPVLRAESGDEALRAAEALIAGGIDILEITLTVPGAPGIIRDLAERFAGSILVGAGTVLTAEQAKECLDSGAAFIVAPNTDPAVIAAARERDAVCCPGALTPTEVCAAFDLGADIVKVFPCDALGGIRYLRSLRSPLPHIPLMPTGGVTLETVAGFLQAGAHAVGVGSNLVDLAVLREDPAEITRRAEAFRRAAGVE
jgi:2-dehydro-3-deoxyphosphogluconate aldolase/(4S)-4-hydroxy-2-oxoglutarate aldolase